MTIRVRLALWYSAILLVGLVLIGGATYYEVVVEHPSVVGALAQQGHTPLQELVEVALLGGLPALVLALLGGWFLMRRALEPVATLTSAVEHVQAETLHQQLPRSHNGDELDRLTEVFNAMMVRLEDSFTRVREFTMHASHELKTPLTVMRTELETALREDQITSAQRDLLASQLDEIQRLTKIVNSLAFLAKADVGQAGLQLAPVRLDELVKDSFTDAQMLARAQRISVEMPACDEVLLNGDRHRLRQLLLNLTDNALKYNQAEGRVALSLTRSNGAAVLKISNTGPGIPSAMLPRVFDRFYRCDPAHSNEIEGCGLGLSIVEWVTKAHHGEIDISSGQEMTTVTVRLPLHDNAAPQLAKAGF